MASINANAYGGGNNLAAAVCPELLILTRDTQRGYWLKIGVPVRMLKKAVQQGHSE
jgi:hypothetical protein